MSDFRGYEMAMREMQDRLAAMDAEIERLRRAEAERERDDLRALLTAVAQSGVSWTTRGYVVAQIDKATWGAVQKIGGGA